MGGAVFNEAGTITITNSTFTANTTSGGAGGIGASQNGTAGTGLGGGLFNHNGVLTVTNSTFSANTAAQGGRDIFNLGDATTNTTTSTTATAAITNTILGQTDTTGQDFTGTINGAGTNTTSGTNNLIRTQIGFTGGFSTADPKLRALANNGGPTQTMSLSISSPAINAGVSGPGIPTTDQRGVNRVGGVDIGAYQAFFFIWTGVTSGQWVVGSNWLGGVAPTDNSGTDYLLFPKAPDHGLGATITQDNIPGGYFDSIDFEDVYSVSGGPFTIKNQIAVGLTNPGITVDMDAPITIASGYTLTVEVDGASSVLTIDTHSGISGLGGNNLVKTGTGTLTLDAVCTYDGSTTISAGTIADGIDNALPTGTALSDSGTLDLAGFNQQVASITGSGTVTGSSATTGTFTINNSGADIFVGLLTGNLNLTKSNTGTLTLTTANTYTGATTISAGKIVDGIDNALPITTALSDNGTLDLNGHNQQVASVTGSGTVTDTSATTGIVFTVNNSGADTFAGLITGNLNLTKSSTGTLTLTTANTYTGPTTTISAGTIADGITNALPIGTALSVNGTLDLKGHNQQVASVTGSGTVTNSSATAGTFTVNNAGADSFAGFLTGNLALTKNNGGILTLNGPGPNSFTGLTTVNAGSLYLVDTTGPAIPGDLVANPGTLVSLQTNNQTAPTSNVTLNSATFNVGSIPAPGVNDAINNLTLNGGIVQIGTGGDLALNGNVGVSANNGAFLGTGSLDLNDGVRTFTVAPGGLLTVSTPIVGGPGSGLTFTGGTMLMNSASANTYQGATNVLNGALNLNSTAVDIPGNLVIGDGIGGANTALVNALKSNVISSSSVVTINSDGALNMGGTTQSIAGLIGSGNVMGTAPGLLTITVQAATTYTFSGVISGTGLKLTKAGPGTEVLAGINTYTGATAVNGGELEVDGKIGPGPVLVNNGGILGGTGAVTGNTVVASGGEIDPGTAGGGVGTLNAQNVTFQSGSILHIDTGISTLAPVTNDKLNGGTITIVNGAQLQFNAHGSCYANGTSFDIVHSTIAYGGVFYVGAIPLNEGATNTIGGGRFKITYVGPPGHDIVLTANRATDVWTGHGANNLWSNAANWSAGVPVAGMDLQFPVTAAQKFNVNNLPTGFDVGEVDFIGVGYGISGNAIVLDAGIQYSAPQSYLTNQFGLNVTLDCNEIWTTSVAANMVDTGSVNTNGFSLSLNDTVGSAGSNLAGAITGTGALSKYGPGAATFSGPASNTFTGPTTVNQGSLNLAKTNPATALNGPLVIGDGIGGPNADLVNIIYGNQIADLAAVVINSSGELNFGTNQDTIGSLTLNGGNVFVDPVLGAIQLTQGLTVNQSATMGEKINLIGAGPHIFNVPTGQMLTLSGQINGTGSSATFTGGGTFNLTGTTENLDTGTTLLAWGTLNLSKANNVFAIYGPLVVGDGTHTAIVNFTQPSQIAASVPITVNANGTLNMGGFSDEVGSITLNGGTLSNFNKLTINGNITSSGTSVLSGTNLYIKEVSRTVNVVSGTLTLNAAVTSIFNAGLSKTGAGTLILGGANSFNGTTTISTGTLQLAGGSLTGPVTIAIRAAAAGRNGAALGR